MPTTMLANVYLFSLDRLEYNNASNGSSIHKKTWKKAYHTVQTAGGEKIREQEANVVEPAFGVWSCNFETAEHYAV